MKRTSILLAVAFTACGDLENEAHLAETSAAVTTPWPDLGPWVSWPTNWSPNTSYTVVNEPDFGHGLLVIGIGPDRRVQFKRQSPSFAWEPWTTANCTGGQVKRVAAFPASWGIDIFAIGTDDRLYHRRRYWLNEWHWNGAGWNAVRVDHCSGWEGVTNGDLIVRDLAIIPSTVGHATLFVIDGNGDVQYRNIHHSGEPDYYDTAPGNYSWWIKPSVWYYLGRPDADDVVQIAPVEIEGRQHLAAIGYGGRAYVRAQIDASWRAWGGWRPVPPFSSCTPTDCYVWSNESVRTTVAARTADASPGGARLAVFAVTNGRAYVTYASNNTDPYAALSPWKQLPFGDEYVFELAVSNNAQDAAPGRGKLEAFAVVANNKLINAWQWTPNDLDWGGFAVRDDGNTLHHHTAARNADGRIELLAIDAYNSLRHNWQVTTHGPWLQ